jgi:hypothetical protein
MNFIQECKAAESSTASSDGGTIPVRFYLLPGGATAFSGGRVRPKDEAQLRQLSVVLRLDPAGSDLGQKQATLRRTLLNLLSAAGIDDRALRRAAAAAAAAAAAVAAAGGGGGGVGASGSGGAVSSDQMSMRFDDALLRDDTTEEIRTSAQALFGTALFCAAPLRFILPFRTCASAALTVFANREWRSRGR